MNFPAKKVAKNNAIILENTRTAANPNPETILDRSIPAPASVKKGMKI
jgi:hypothetical protein